VWFWLVQGTAWTRSLPAVRFGLAWVGVMKQGHDKQKPVVSGWIYDDHDDDDEKIPSLMAHSNTVSKNISNIS
jgi:hypothetical protein